MKTLPKEVMQKISGSLLFRDLSSVQIDDVIASAQIKLLGKGEVLFRQSDTAEHTYLVVAGQIKLAQVSADGAQTLLRVIGPGQVLAIVSTLEKTLYPATAISERDTTLLRWSGRDLDLLFFKVPGLSRNAVAILSARIREMQDRFSELASERTERRLARALTRLAEGVGRKTQEGVVLDLALSRQDLAEMIGTTLFSVSRILTDWKKKSWVKVGRQKVILLSPQSLIKVAEEEPARD